MTTVTRRDPPPIRRDLHHRRGERPEDQAEKRGGEEIAGRHMAVRQRSGMMTCVPSGRRGECDGMTVDPLAPPRRRLYFAAPLFSAAERRFNEELAAKLESLGIEVFLPQRDGVEPSKPPYDAMDPDRRRRAMFEMDREQIRRADIFLIVLDGRVPDEGACVELGLAHAFARQGGERKLLIGLHTDTRAAFVGAKLNPMLSLALDRVVETEPELLEAVRTFSEPRGE
jgi:nucleoside 2-deoxyribosyltransferase